MILNSASLIEGLRRGVPNTITLLRVVFTCFLNYYIFNHFGKMMIPLIIFSLIFLTDYADGKIARLYGLATPFGAAFDLLADLFFIISSCMVLYVFQIIPLWFLFVILFKFIEFVVTSFFISKSDGERTIFVFDFIGRLVAVVFYMIPALLYISYRYSPVMYTFCINRLSYIILLLALFSSTYRIRICFRIVRVSSKRKVITQTGSATML